MPEGEPAQGKRRDGEPRRLVIWRFSDGKPGHDNQSLGLAEALAGEIGCEIHSLAPMGTLTALAHLATGRGVAYPSFPDPDLIIGAGHATHLSMLAARRARGGRVVVLMTPTLPNSLFDLCLIPEHDRPGDAANAVATRGALNRVRPCADKEIASGLILIGGPSPHFAFETRKVLAQIQAVLEEGADVLWTAATSRRTPSDFTTALRALEAPNLVVVPVEETSPDWLAGRLGRTARAWVSEDSASMVYEALSSGAAVGLLALEAKRPGRLSRGIELLVTDGWVTRFHEWREGHALAPPDAPLNEARRCAKIILDRWPGLADR